MLFFPSSPLPLINAVPPLINTCRSQYLQVAFYDAHVMPGNSWSVFRWEEGRTKLERWQCSSHKDFCFFSGFQFSSPPPSPSKTELMIWLLKSCAILFCTVLHSLHLHVSLFRPLSSTDSALLPPLCFCWSNRGWHQINNRPLFFGPFCAFAVLCSGGIVRARDSDGKWWNVPCLSPPPTSLFFIKRGVMAERRMKRVTRVAEDEAARG